ncbi:homing endonuclease [Tokyovirus A1]|uniref:homing endonuclease n=1 Tax=Tokyovirus A1 TaxID=1826170 RepID=UPI0007A97604|nr:homing endonuclease [Tokyovirus A1]BAU80217.1 Vsr/MutH/archaeal HJR family nuclease [Tokyovirus A1]
MSLAKRTEEARRRFAEKGCTMTGEYVNAKTKVEYTCHCGKEGLFALMNSVNLETWSGCKDCSLKAKKERCLSVHGVEDVSQLEKNQEKRLKTPEEKYGGKSPLSSLETMEKKRETEAKSSLEAAMEFFTSKGCVMTGEYVNDGVETEFTCHCGSEGNFVKLRIAKGNKGGAAWAGCKECAAKARNEKTRLTKEENKDEGKEIRGLGIREEQARKYFESKGCIMTGEYVNNSTKVEYTCHCGTVGNFVALKTAQKDNWGGCRKCEPERTKKKNLEKFGCEVPMRNEEVKKKMEETLLKNYGVTNPLKSEAVKEKKKKTMMEKYGVEHSAQNPEIVEKTKATCMEKYGVNTCLSLPENMKKGKDALFEKYGRSGPLGNQEHKEKMHSTMKEKYGVEHALQVEEFRQKSRETCLKNWGVEYSSQHPKVREKAMKSSYSFRDYSFPSGRTIKIQGYENFAIDILLSEGVQEEDIFGCYEKDMSFPYSHKGKNSFYFPDIFVASRNLIIEVKSTWTLRGVKPDEEEKTLKKLETCRRAGYKTRLLVLGSKGEILEDREE